MRMIRCILDIMKTVLFILMALSAVGKLVIKLPLPGKPFDRYIRTPVLPDAKLGFLDGLKPS